MSQHSRLTMIRAEKICKCGGGLCYRPLPPTVGQADTTITASAPCVCRICVCSFVITGKGRKKTNRAVLLLLWGFIFFGGGGGNNWTKVQKSKDTRRESRQTVKRTAIKHSPGNYLRPKTLLFWIPNGFTLPKHFLRGRPILCSAQQ